MEIKSLPSLYVIGKKVSCSWQELSSEMPKAWKEIITRKGEIQSTSTSILDICLLMRDGQFTQLLGMEAAESQEIPDGMEGVHIPAQRYVYTKHTGPVMEIANTYGDMIKWAKENQYTLDPDDLKIQYTPEDDSEGFDLYIKII